MIKIIGIDYKLIMNNPETWQIYIAYDRVPFSEIIIQNSDVEMAVDIDSADAAEKVALFDKICNFLPLTSYEDAKKMNDIIGTEQGGLYSSRLITTLTEETVSLT